MQDEGLSVVDLEIMKLGLEDKVKQLEIELQCPLEANYLIMRRLLEVEKTNLRKVNFEIDLKRRAGK